MVKKRAKDMTLTRESMVLIAICTLDLVATLLFINTKTAAEGNPLMAFYLRYGTGTFIMMKLMLMFLPIFIFEWSRQFRPVFVKFMLRVTIAMYLVIYLLLFLTINVGVGAKDEIGPGPINADQVEKTR